MNRKKYQLVVARSDGNMASSKAPADVSIIAEKLGFSRIELRLCNIPKLLKFIYQSIQVMSLYKKIPYGSVLFIQNPVWYRALTFEKTFRKLKNQKAVKFINLVHDVEELRNPDCERWLKKELMIMLKYSNAIIVHNQKMEDYFITRGIDKERLINLDIFDYLSTDSIHNMPLFERGFTIAGNLDTSKAGYIKQLGMISDVNIRLYGPNYNEKLGKFKNISYHGSLPADELPRKLDRGFGLVWDGNSLNTCSGRTGEYLRYNNPHKLSLYLASGLPVIIWREAAEADFVIKNHIGLCVDSLEEIPYELRKINESKYYDMAKHVIAIRTKLLSGFYTQKAITIASNQL